MDRIMLSYGMGPREPMGETKGRAGTKAPVGITRGITRSRSTRELEGETVGRRPLTRYNVTTAKTNGDHMSTLHFPP